jgi:hypothetical protein
VYNELTAYDAVRLGISAPLESSWFPQLPHLLLKGGDDRAKKFLLVWQCLLLGDLQSVVRPLKVDQRGRQPCDRIAQHSVKRRTNPWIESSLKTQESVEGIANAVEERGTRVGSRLRTAGV